MACVASYASVAKALPHLELQFVLKRCHVNALWAIFITLAPTPAHQSNRSVKELYIQGGKAGFLITVLINVQFYMIF